MRLRTVLLIEKDGENRDFSLQTRCITKLFERLFVKDFNTVDCRHINFFCGSYEKFQVAEYVDGFYDVEIPYDINAFFYLSDQAKKEEIYILLKKSLAYMISEKSWDKEPFVKTFDLMKELDLKNESFWGKPKWNPTKTLKAQVYWVHGLYNFTIYLEVKNKQNELVLREKMTSLLPDDLIYSDYLGKLMWESNSIVTLSHKYAKESFSLNLQPLLP